MRTSSVVPALVALIVISVTPACRSVDTPTSPSDLDSAPAARVSRDVVATQSAADAISANIRALHMPYGTLADPGFASADSTSPEFTTVVSYNRTGDGA